MIMQKRHTCILPTQSSRWKAHHRLHRFYRLFFSHKLKVYVGKTENQLGTTSILSIIFSTVKAQKENRKHICGSSMILGFHFINSLISTKFVHWCRHNVTSPLHTLNGDPFELPECPAMPSLPYIYAWSLVVKLIHARCDKVAHKSYTLDPPTSAVYNVWTLAHPIYFFLLSIWFFYCLTIPSLIWSLRPYSLFLKHDGEHEFQYLS